MLLRSLHLSERPRFNCVVVSLGCVVVDCKSCLEAALCVIIVEVNISMLPLQPYVSMLPVATEQALKHIASMLS